MLTFFNFNFFLYNKVFPCIKTLTFYLSIIVFLSIFNYAIIILFGHFLQNYSPAVSQKALFCWLKRRKLNFFVHVKKKFNTNNSVPGFRIMYASPLSYAAIPSIQNACSSCLSLRVFWNTKKVFWVPVVFIHEFLASSSKRNYF